MAMLAEMQLRHERYVAAKRAEEARALTEARELLDREEQAVRRRLDRCLLTWMVLAEEPDSNRAISLSDIYPRMASVRRSMMPLALPNSLAAVAKRRGALRGPAADAVSITSSLDAIASSTSMAAGSRSRRARYDALDGELRVRQPIGAWPSTWLEKSAAAGFRDLRQRLLARTSTRTPVALAVDRRDSGTCQHNAPYGRCQYVTCAFHPNGGLAMDAD
jgi:hypothetical protein